MTKLGGDLSASQATSADWASAATAWGIYCNELDRTGWNSAAWSMVEGPSSLWLEYEAPLATATAVSNLVKGWGFNLTAATIEVYVNGSIIDRQSEYPLIESAGLLNLELGLKTGLEHRAGVSKADCKYDCKMMGTIVAIACFTGNEIVAGLGALWMAWNC